MPPDESLNPAPAHPSPYIPTTTRPPGQKAPNPPNGPGHRQRSSPSPPGLDPAPPQCHRTILSSSSRSIETLDPLETSATPPPLADASNDDRPTVDLPTDNAGLAAYREAAAAEN